MSPPRLERDAVVSEAPKVAAQDLRGIPADLAAYFDLDGDRVISDREILDVVDYFDGTPPGNGNRIIDGSEAEAVRAFVRRTADVREINEHTARRLADALRTEINCWATESQGDFDRTARMRDRVERRYKDFSRNDALVADTLVTVSNLVFAVGLSRRWTVASILVPYALIEGARWIRGRDLVIDTELRAKMEAVNEKNASDRKRAISEIQKELLDLVDAVSCSPAALRSLEKELSKRLIRPRVPLEDEIYRDALLLHAKKNGCSVVGSTDNVQRAGRFYTSRDVWNPLRISGPAIASELNRLDPETRMTVDTKPNGASPRDLWSVLSPKAPRFEPQDDGALTDRSLSDARSTIGRS